MNKRIFVTGASGMVGWHVVKHMVARGYEVVAGVRPSSKVDALRDLGSKVTLTTAELNDCNALTRGMQGCSAVVHCAGAVDPHAKRESIMETNVEGTKNVLASAIAAGVTQLIHISSLSVITGQEDQFNVNESAPLRYCGESYADSKVDAEKAVQAAPATINITVLRPGFIYGPGERAWMPPLINSLAQGKVMLVDGGTKQTNVIYVENLCRAVELSLFNPAAYGQVYNLTDGNTPTKKELFDAICLGMGLPKVTKKIPGVVAKTVCEAVSAAAPFLPPAVLKKVSRFSRAAFRLVGVNQGFDVSKAERELGYTERIPFNTGMAQTLESFREPASNTSNAANKVTTGSI